VFLLHNPTSAADGRRRRRGPRPAADAHLVAHHVQAPPQRRPLPARPAPSGKGRNAAARGRASPTYGIVAA